MLQLSLALAAAGAPAVRAGDVAPVNPRLTGAPLVRTWTAEDYAAAPVNYDLLQHPDSGFIYVANDYGVLEFDGATWRLIELPNGNSAHSLAIDPTGRIFVGGDNEIALRRRRSRQLGPKRRIPAALVFARRATFGHAVGSDDRPRRPSPPASL